MRDLGPLRLQSELGSGGMGTVHLATVRSTVAGLEKGQRVAVKVLRPELFRDPTLPERWMREAQIGRAVNHPNVVRTLSVGYCPDNRSHYLTMEYVEGETLYARLQKEGPFSEQRCRYVGLEMAKGLAAIHATGAIHRDIKPGNVLITPDNVVKIMDLGLALLVDEAVRLTSTGFFVGTWGYAPPEQLGRRDIDARADIYSLGASLFELATGGCPPIHSEAPAVTETRPEFSDFFEELMRGLLYKDREKRLSSTRAVVEILEQGEEAGWWARRIKARTRRPRRRIGVRRDTALYGRDAEIGQLEARYQQAKAGDGRVVFIEGEAGIGKSRLVDEFVAQARQAGEDLNFLFGSYMPGGAATAVGAFTTAYLEHFGSEGLEETLGNHLAEAPRLIPAFAAFLRAEPPPKDSEHLTKESLQAAFAQVTKQISKERPTVVFIDDLHFAPEEGLALFSAVAQQAASQHLLLIGSSRQGLDPGWVAEIERFDHTDKIELARLERADLKRLLGDAFHSEQLAAEVTSRIAEKADGNPLFVFEIIQGLREVKVLGVREDGTWVRKRPIEKIEIPSKVMRMIEARISELGPQEKELLAVACCCGFAFDPLLVAEVRSWDAWDVLTQLDRIERDNGLVRSVGQLYEFDHHQVQEALYQGLAEPRKKLVHAGLAATIERQAAPAKPEEIEGTLAVQLCEHYLKAGRGQQGLLYLDAALNHFHDRYLSDHAVVLVDRALKAPNLLEGRGRLGVLERKWRWLNLLGRREEERATLDEALAIADETGEPALRAQVRAALGAHLQSVSRYEDARASLNEALAIGREAVNVPLQADVGRQLGWLLFETGYYDEARDELARALELSRECEDARGEAACRANLAVVHWWLGRCGEAHEDFARQLAFFGEVEDRRSEAVTRINLGLMLSDLGAQEQARASIEDGLDFMSEIGDRQVQAFTLDWLAQVAERTGNLNRARGLFEGALSVREEILATGRVAETLVGLGRVEAAMGRQDAAVEHLDTAMEMAGRMDLPGPAVLAAVHRSLLPRGWAETAVEALEKYEERLKHREKIEARFFLWKRTLDKQHLATANELVTYLREHAPEAYREATVHGVPLHAEILAAWQEQEP